MSSGDQCSPASPARRFLAGCSPSADGSPRPAKQRDDATTALTTVLALRGVWGVRVHSVRASRDAIAVAQRLRSATDFRERRVSGPLLSGRSSRDGG